MQIFVDSINNCLVARTLEVAKTVIKHKSFVYNKSDLMVDLSDDEKLQNVSFLSSFVLKNYQIVQQDFWLSPVSFPECLAESNNYFCILHL